MKINHIVKLSRRQVISKIHRKTSSIILAMHMIKDNKYSNTINHNREDHNQKNGLISNDKVVLIVLY